MPTQDLSMFNNMLMAPASPMDMANKVAAARVAQAQAQMAPMQVDNAKLENAQNHLQFITSQLTPLIALGDKVQPSDVATAATNAVALSKGAISPDEASQFVSQVLSHPQGIPAALQKVQLTALDGMNRIATMRGQNGWVSDGTGLHATNTNSFNGNVNAAGGNMSNVQVYPSRAEMAAPATVGFDQRSGAPLAGTTQQQVNARGGSDLLAPAFRTAGAGAAPPAAPTGTTPPPAAAAPAVSATAAAGATATPGPQQVPMEAPMKALQDDFANSSAKMQGTQPLLQALPLIQQLGASGAGPSSDTVNRLKSFLVTNGVIKPDDTNVDVRNEANKYLKKYVAASGASGAGGSDYRTAFTSESNPNLDTDQKATLSLAKAAVAFDRMDAARPLAFGANQNAQINQYGTHKATWAQSQDPRAYGLDLMDPPKRQALLDQMKAQANTPAGKKFWSSLKIAHDNGMLTGPTNAGQ